MFVIFVFLKASLKEGSQLYLICIWGWLPGQPFGAFLLRMSSIESWSRPQMNPLFLSKLYLKILSAEFYCGNKIPQNSFRRTSSFGNRRQPPKGLIIHNYGNGRNFRKWIKLVLICWVGEVGWSVERRSKIAANMHRRSKCTPSSTIFIIHVNLQILKCKYKYKYK